MSQIPFLMLVGTGGFEPPAPCSQGRCADQTALRPEYFCAESVQVGDVVSQGRVQCKSKTHGAWGIEHGVKSVADCEFRIANSGRHGDG